jgi:hypothetical protein
MAVIAVMRGFSNKHYKLKLVRVLFDSGSDTEGDLIFVSKARPILLPFSKRLVAQLQNNSNGIFQTKHKARVKLNFFEYSDSKRYYSGPDVVKFEKGSKLQYDLIVGTKTMKELGMVLDFKAKMITIDEISLPMRNTNHVQGTKTLCVLKLNNSLAM